MTSVLEYSDKDHKYYADGRERISVTQILAKAGLVSPFAINEEAAQRGSLVHEFCAIDDGEGLDLRKVPKDLRGYLRAWRKYRQDSGFSPVLIEQRIDCHRNGYAGRFDRVGYRTGSDVSIMLDIKTSKAGTVPEYAGLQLVAYSHALRPGHIFERIAVGLRPDGRYNCKIFPLNTFQTDLARFLSILKQVKEDTAICQN